MNYEKKYKEAQGWIEKIYPTLQHEQQMEAEAFFPELKESEDERIREEIIATIHLYYGEPLEDEAKEMIAWLEKQGEKPSAIRWYDASLIPQEMEELLVEWESEDATWHEIAFYHADTKTFWDGTRQVKNVTRWCYIIDLLEKQAAQKPFDYENANIQQKDFAPQVEQKPAWSEEDGEMLNLIIARLHSHPNVDKTEYDKSYHWLKSLKDRFTWKPSDEQIEALESATENCAYSEYQDCLKDLIEQLKKLKG